MQNLVLYVQYSCLRTLLNYAGYTRITHVFCMCTYIYIHTCTYTQHSVDTADFYDPCLVSNQDSIANKPHDMALLTSNSNDSNHTATCNSRKLQAPRKEFKMESFESVEDLGLRVYRVSSLGQSKGLYHAVGRSSLPLPRRR